MDRLDPLGTNLLLHWQLSEQSDYNFLRRNGHRKGALYGVIIGYTY
jgi:hypothetical protein